MSRSKSFSLDALPDIKRFIPGQMAQTSCILVLGRRFSGKSVLIKDLMYRMKDRINKGIIFSGTEHANPFYGTCFPDIYIHKKYDGDLLERIVQKQSKVASMQLKESKSKVATARSTLFVLMDDCLADSNWKSDDSMKEIFFNGRHYHFLFLMASQYPMAVPASFRNNADYTFIYSDKDIKNRKRLYENYCGMVPTFELFNELMDQVCQDFRCLVIDNRKRDHNDWTDVVSWYKAEEREDFRFGSEEFWKYHEKYIRDSNDDDEQADYLKCVVNKYGTNNIQRIRLVD